MTNVLMIPLYYTFWWAKKSWMEGWMWFKYKQIQKRQIFVFTLFTGFWMRAKKENCPDVDISESLLKAPSFSANEIRLKIY